MVYLEEFTRQKKLKQLVRGAARERVVDSIIDSLRDWRFTVFESEATCRHALRLHFIDRGNGWSVSDLEASTIIASAFDRIGAKRPTWLEGQREYAAPRDHCMHCRGPLDEEDMKDNLLFCSAECARLANASRRDVRGTFEMGMYRRVQYELAMRDAKPRPCEHCGAQFRNVDPKARYCSTVCWNKVQGLNGIAARPCGWCEKVFQPEARKNRYCCMSCAKLDAVRIYRASAPEKTCSCCGVIFRPNKPHALYCSKSCQKRASYLRQRVRPLLPTLTPPIFDDWFREAA